MKCEPEQLYTNYTNRKPDASGAFDRMRQRLRWLRSYKLNGTCKRKLQRAGIIKVVE